MRYLITGKNGQLARAFIREFEKRSIDFIAPDESRLDITNAASVAEAVAAYAPDVIMNCAAYNLVDRAEQEQGRAFAVNASGPKHLAQAAARQKAVLVHFGSDYVFDGTKENGLYEEDDPVNPLNEYGKSKRSGEDFVREACGNFLIFRLSWLYGAGKQNFIHKLRSWARDSEYLKIACDEFSVPTCADTVVDITLRSLDEGLQGLYHLTNSGFCSRYEWARFIAGQLGIHKFIRPVSMESFNLPAKRPKFSAMNNAKLSGVLNISIPAWEAAVEAFMREEHFAP
ncbi:MAG TPA: dTDP-4-dehydrorhamnose reductase [Nitrospirota bacterium]|nr:dTDP-4-dehydrorhamnose reductase [Nitrospirota bacterium]